MNGKESVTIKTAKVDTNITISYFGRSHNGVISLAKGKGGTGQGTGKKGWNRWQTAERKAANTPKPYKSKGTKKPKPTSNP